MRKRSTTQINAKTEMARRVAEHYFGSSLRGLEYKPAGMTNFVFEAQTGAEHFIVRIGGGPEKLHDFLKEQWVTQKVAEKGVPVPEVLEVGNRVIPFPYMVQRRVDGREATDHPERLSILARLGKYARLIHSIPTTGFGHEFDWSQNKLSRNQTWPAYLEEELQATGRITFLQKNGLLPKGKVTHLRELLEKIKKWKTPPALNHSDLRLKNVLVDEAGEIRALIDWDNCTSNIAPYWDLSIALHDLSIDGKHRFLEGYGIDFAEFNRHAYALTVFNLLNYTPYLRSLVEGGHTRELEFYKLRLNGSLDLFSL